MSKKTLTIFVAAAALLTFPLFAAAADKLVVEDGAANKIFAVDDTGNVGFNIDTPNYAADVVSQGNASKSQLHFSLDGSDYGGYLTSVLPNNFFISSGAVYDLNAGGWIQKDPGGRSVFFGSGTIGFRAFLQDGQTPGELLTQNQVMLIDYQGNLMMDGGLQMNGSPTPLTKPACNSSKQGMLWMTKGSTDVVEICASKGGTLAWYSLSF